MQRLIFIVLFFLYCGHSLSAINPKYELRGVWLATNHRLDWPSVNATDAYSRDRQKAELCAILDKLKAANFNSVFFQTRVRGDLFHASTIEPWSIYLTGRYGKDPGYDPLGFAIEECHKRGMECHAWIVVFPVGTNEQVKQMGRRSVVKQKPQLCKLYNGEWYLNPGEPGTTSYLRSIVGEIVRNYDIDGIHFDYIRYPEKASKFPDSDSYRKYGKKMPLAEWRKNNITRIQSALYEEVKQLNPRVLVSAAPLGKYRRLDDYPSVGWTGLESVYQDAGQWMREGICDFIVPMMYYFHEQFFPFVDNWVTQSRQGFVAPGLGIYRLEESDEWNANDITDQIDYGRYHGTKGNVFFRCKNLLSNYGLYETLKTEYYRYPALMPVCSSADEAMPPPSGLSVTHDGDMLCFSWDGSTAVEEPIYLLYRNIPETGQPQLIARITGETTFFLMPEEPSFTASSYFLTLYNRHTRSESRPSPTIKLLTPDNMR